MLVEFLIQVAPLRWFSFYIIIAPSSPLLISRLIVQGFSAAEAQKAVEGHPDAHPEAVKIVNEKPSTTASTDSSTNYAVIGGIIGALAIGYWYFSGSSSKKGDKDKE